MGRRLTYRPFHQRLLSGMIAGLIVGFIIGFGIAIRTIQVNDTLIASLHKALLQLHLAGFYGLLLLIVGLIVGALVLGRRREVSLVAQGIIFLIAFLVFYYIRNWLSFSILARLDGIRWPLEIVGFVVLACACWILYKLLLFLEENAKGWIVRIAVALVVLLFAWNIYRVVKPPLTGELPSESPILPAPAADVKVALIGMDGAWWDIMDPLMEAGKMPMFQSLIDRGIRSKLQTFKPTKSPMIWNTIATGKMPDKHRISCFRVWRFPVSGVMIPASEPPRFAPEFKWILRTFIRVTPVTSNLRMTEAIWNMLSDAGLSVGVINWWASYPAEPVNGYNVSDHALYNRLVIRAVGEKRFGDPYSTYPQELLPELESLIADLSEIPADSVARFIHIESDRDREWYKNTKDCWEPGQGCEAAMFQVAYPEDITMLRTALYLLENYDQPDFFALYMKGLDAIQHWYLPYYFYERHQDVLTPENIARLKDLVPNYYMYMDEVLGLLLDALEPNTIVILVSDHGFDHRLLRKGIYHHHQAPPAMLVMAGDNIKQSENITATSVSDITPTILSLFGLPIGRDMDGQVIADAFATDTVPIDWVDTYDTKDREKVKVETSRLPEVDTEKLRALGYVK